MMIKEDTQKADNEIFKLNNSKLLILFVLFVVFYFSFLAFANIIHGCKANFDIEDVLRWLQGYALENDGIELYVMTIATPIYFLISYFIICYLSINFGFLSKKWISISYFTLLSGFLIINFIYKEPLVLKMLKVFTVVVLLAAFIVYLTRFKLRGYYLIILYLILFVLMIIIGLLINYSPSIFDYCFYIGPANKIINGERLGTFYIQYNLIGTFLFAVMQKCHLWVHEMWFVLIVLFSFWILLYLKAAALLFKNKTIVGLFLLALFIVRCLSISGGPVYDPQISAIRMDLWVPLLIVVLCFGFRSVVTALVFSSCYMLDDVFGLMYLTLYVVIVIYYFCLELYDKKKMKLLVKDIILFVLPIISLTIHYIIFGGIESSAAKIYSDFHFGFLPISKYSSFWLIAWAFPICIYFLCQNKQNRILYLFIFALACIQLTYFFGRSHEHNLRNISGITIFIIFLTIDAIYSLSSRKTIILWASVVFIGGIAVNFSSTIVEKVNLSVSKIKSGKLIEPDPVEKQIGLQGAYLKSIGVSKILVINDIDSYINYRLGYQQTGYFSPFYANYSVRNTVSFLKDRINEGYRLIIFPYYSLGFYADYFNETKFMLANKERVILQPLNENLYEMKFVHY
jgi:hypothetical protein